MARSAAKRTPQRDYAQEITDHIIQLLGPGDQLNWRMPWRRSGGARPLRSCGTAYRGINDFWLSLLGGSSGYGSPFWMTYRQAQELGGQVRKGEKSAPVVYYGTAKCRNSEEGDDAAGPEAEGHYRFLKGYAVFNASQIDGLPEEFYPQEEIDTGARADDRLEAFFAGLPSPVIHGFDYAAWMPKTDEIRMPDINRFESASHYYATLFHEHAHASGAKGRLERRTLAFYHSDKAVRAEEELIAEIAAAMGGRMIGLPADHIEDHAAYIQSWLRSLKSDKRFIFRAAAEAQRAVDWIFAEARAAGGYRDAA